MFEARKLDTPLDKMTREKSGKRSYSRTDRKRGRYIQARPANDKFDDIAFDATLRNAAPHQKERHESGESELALQLRMSDLQRKVRVRRTGNLILFVVDASWSMAASERMEATKGAIFSLLVEAYQRRDQVGLVVFQRDKARVVLPPTNSVELAEKGPTRPPCGRQDPAQQRPVGDLAGGRKRPAPRFGTAPIGDASDRRRRQRKHDRHAGPGRGDEDCLPLCE